MFIWVVALVELYIQIGILSLIYQIFFVKTLKPHNNRKCYRQKVLGTANNLGLDICFDMTFRSLKKWIPP